MTDEPKIVQVVCPQCGGSPRNHIVVCEHVNSRSNAYGDITVWNSYQIVKCMGCDAVRFRQFEVCTESRDPETGDLEEYNDYVFPNSPVYKHQAIDVSGFPAEVSKIYSETVGCFNAGANTLAGGGLRATVEAICRNRQVQGANLEQRINNLVAQGHLAQTQADLLHEERYLGNEALHEMSTPTDRDVRDGLEIVEGLLKTVYVLPVHADRLRQRRTQSP